MRPNSKLVKCLYLQGAGFPYLWDKGVWRYLRMANTGWFSPFLFVCHKKKIIMGYKFLRFFGALIAVNVFIFSVEIFHLLCMIAICEFLEDFSWRSLYTFDTLKGIIIPIAWVIFYLSILGIAKLVRGSKIIATLPIISFVIAAINLFIKLFIYPNAAMMDKFNSDIWYYLLSITTYLVIIGWFTFCSIGMFTYKESNEY